MEWLFVMACFVYCFTLGFTYKYKEQALEEREKRIDQQRAFEEELSVAFKENAILRDELCKKT